MRSLCELLICPACDHAYSERTEDAGTPQAITAALNKRGSSSFLLAQKCKGL